MKKIKALDCKSKQNRNPNKMEAQTIQYRGFINSKPEKWNAITQTKWNLNNMDTQNL